MKHSKTFFAALALTLLCTTAAAALPGVDAYIPDESGEFIYYSDYSFERTSYIGFMYYNDSTYAIRYYAPVDTTKKLFEKDITLYFLIDPEAEHLTLKGERITGETESSDKDIINYLHDLFYEFTARRQKVSVTGLTKVQNTEDFAQFGGTVQVTYSNIAPIFNIESIRAADGTVLFKMLSTGMVSSDSDNSFPSFKGVEGLPKDNARSFSSKKTKAVTVTFGTQTVTLDESWEASLDNLWFKGNEALLSLNEVSEAPMNRAQYETYLCRKLCQGTNGSFSVLPQTRIEINGASVTITALHYEPSTGNVTRDFNILTKKADGSYTYLKLTVFDGIYQANKQYFTTILNSYQIQ